MEFQDLIDRLQDDIMLSLARRKKEALTINRQFEIAEAQYCLLESQRIKKKYNGENDENFLRENNIRIERFHLSINSFTYILHNTFEIKITKSRNSLIHFNRNQHYKTNCKYFIKYKYQKSLRLA